MSAKPPPIPELVYQRVMLVGKVDGWLLMVGAGLLALFLAPSPFLIFMIAACLAAGTGAMELHGSHLLARGEARGIDWMVRAQLLLMFVVMGFVLYYCSHFDEEFFSALIPEMREMSARTYPRLGLSDPYEQLTDKDMLMLMRLSINMSLFMVGMISCVYQGLMARYYHKRRAVIAQVLDN